MKKFILCCLSFLFIGIVPCVTAQETSYFEKLVPLYEAKKDFGPYGWMATQKESEQSFSEYTAATPIVPSKTKPYIYIVLLGEFSELQQKALQMTSRYMEIYFQMPVKFSAPIPLSVIPQKARRTHSQTGDKQILTSYIIEDVLKPRMPKDAFCLIAFTASDLWPQEGWNFVFGQASMEDRVGVWSIYRNGDPEKDFMLFLKRTIQTGTHEIGHLFGLAHCVYYECNMNGSNSRYESDQRPLWECPVCLRKLVWATKADPIKRYRELIAICKEFGLRKEAEFFERSIEKK